MNTTDHQPITGPGIQWASQQILAHFNKIMLPKITATLTDTIENPARCYQCQGEPPETGCPTCGLAGDLPELESVDITLRRGFDEVPCQVSFKDGKLVEAWVVANVGDTATCDMCDPDGTVWNTEDQAFVDCPYCGNLKQPPRFAEGTSISLLPCEEAAALDALRAKPEASELTP